MKVARLAVSSLAAACVFSIASSPSRGQGPGGASAPAGVIALETVEATTAPGANGPLPAPQAGRQPIVLPSRQASGDFRAMGGNAALAKLPNPFLSGQPVGRRGLFGHATPQSPPAGSARPGALPGSGAPTYESAPGTSPYPGTGAAGETPGGAQPAPSQPSATGAAQPPAPAAGAADAFAAASATNGPGFGGGLEGGTSNFAMIGDQSPFRFRSFLGASPGATLPQPPPVPGPRAASLFYPSMRGFKIAENMSPRPQNRFFFDFNYYNNVNDTINTNDGVPINHIQAFRYLFGWEQTFNEGKGSIGLRVPINNATGDSNLAQGTGGTTRVNVPTRTAMGNLAVFAKYILEENPRTGSLASVGLAVTTPTGPGRFAGAPWFFGLNTVTIQPFLGYLYNYNNWYIQGFSAFDFPGSVQDVTLMYNDVGIGYYLLRSSDPRRFLTALAPTFEVHVNTPLTHRDWKNRFDIAGTPDVVNLTYGLNFQFYGRATLTTALITPVSSPQPFNTEFAMLLNFYYGRSRSTLPVTPPPSL
ncbi:hypothetical protein OJF2_61820 [Aquisphaera giovannonii]|uniref:MetA-pathway of phenol degradation n=1 Tax=Aquisphaera giovannonii TaxID=406548 RepID=A0A5B9WCB9_9BACT|nr:hypothetical protein [Aquisphaera giovannonii]QEH37591.1 hypothetical protein OJF2_61820 [Aquisphaera giovannonii]